MANRVTVTILEEGPRNAVVSVAGVLDTSDYAGVSAIALSSFTNNDVGQTLRYFAVDKVEYAINSTLGVVLDWQATANQLAFAITDSNELNFNLGGGLFPVNSAAAGFTGNFDINTVGWAAGTKVFTIILKLKKIYT